MKNRNEKIKEIESLIAQNKGTRREFISSFGKTVALGTMAAMGIASLLSCEKEYESLNPNRVKSTECNDKSIECQDSPFECLDYKCGVKKVFGCIDDYACIGDPTCILDYYHCTSYVHDGGSAS